ncbi:Diadenosine tetraphosphatase and related serine/threonine protein phosphatases [Lacticaseibacillus rhamnosus R0011]|nr:Diadenosine tetraphosphatase and related serine/threonine protein phosphatases [Lacticaseibacillus rhamnosus R0011]
MPIQTAAAFDYAKADERLVLTLGSVGIKSGALSISYWK